MPPATLSQWNSALITALFLRPDKARTTLSRIDVTGRVLEAISGGQDRSTAKQSFTKAFGSDPNTIKNHFTLLPEIAVMTRRDGIPPNFAALYLSLLAASADDDTFQVGNFRMRFAALIEIDELASFHFEDLPALWKQFALWSKNRAASVGDCAVLVLPDPQHETRIGHAKRLAFPTYRDELYLRSALADFAVDSRDPFQDVSRAAHERLGKFSHNFKDELIGFRTSVYAERSQEAYDSPFWGAVRDITYEEVGKELAQFGRLCVQLDIADPQFPELSVLADERALLAFGKEQALRLPRAFGPYVAALGSSSLKASISALLSIVEKDKVFARSRLGGAVKAGCLPFFQDDIGALSSDGRYVENEPWCLLIRSGTVQRIMSLANHLRQKCTEVVTVETAGPWTLLSFSATSKLFMERLGLEVPAGARKLFSQGWVPAVPRISGVARYGQAVLLTPASNPMVRLEGAISGQYAILNASGVELAGGTLLACEEGLYIPPSQLVELKGQVICRFELKVADSSLNHVLEVAVVDGVPGTPLVWADNRHTWLIDGRLGVRESLAASFLPAGEPLVSPVGRLDHLGGSWPLFAYSPSNAPACMHANLEALHPALAWLADAVSLRFQTRGNMQFGDLDAHLRMAGEAVGIESWRLRRTLISGGWLLPIGSALSPHVSVAAATRTISWSRQGGRVIARIRGMLTTQERAALATMAVSGDCIQRIVDPGMPLAIGCIELDVSDEESVLKISSKLQLHRLPTVEAARDVFGGLISSRTQAAVDAAPVPSGAVSLWDAGSFGWVPERVSREQLPVGAILRSEGRQRHVFHIKMERGYRRTDSRSWALMIKASCAPEGLGTISQCGDVDWAKSLLSLPNALCCWWTHFGGGVVSIGDSGSYAFRGGNGLHLWEGIVDTDRRLQDRHECRATERRARALAILKHKRMQRVF